MAESRRENEGSCDFPFFALAALPMLRSPALGLRQCRLLVSGQCRSLGFGGIAGPLVSGRCRPLGFGAMLVPGFRAMPAPGFRAFILTASKSRINDETPLNSCTLQGRSSLFREIAVLG